MTDSANKAEVGILTPSTRHKDAYNNILIVKATEEMSIPSKSFDYISCSSSEALYFTPKIINTTEVIGYEGKLNDDGSISDIPIYATEEVGTEVHFNKEYGFSKKYKSFYHKVPIMVTKTITTDTDLNADTLEPAVKTDYAYYILSSGDTINNVVNGCWVTIDNGTLEIGDLIQTSNHGQGGWFEKQPADPDGEYRYHNYTIGRVMQPVTEDSKNVYAIFN